MIIDAKGLDSAVEFNADICILGGGVAGIVLANELAATGASIVVIESGGEYYTPEAQALYASARPNPSWYPDTTHSRLRFLGGSSNHWENNVSPFDPIDFERREWIADSGWPISYDEVRPYYTKAAVYCGVSDDGYDVDFWQEKLNKKVVTQGSDVIETGIAKASRPPVRFFEIYKDSLASFDNIKIIIHADVVDLDYSAAEEKVESITFLSAKSNRHKVKAKIFVMCFGGIENARMLLSFNEKYENKIGNKNDNVGRYFMDHPVVRGAHFFAHDPSIYGLYDITELTGRIVVGFFKFKKDFLIRNKITNLRMPISPATNYVLSDGISSHHILGDALKQGDVPDALGTHLMNYIRDIDMVAEAVARKGFNTKLFDHADDIGGYELAVMIEQTPHRENRIKLSEIRDRLGIKKLEIDWEVKAEDRERYWKGMEFFASEVARHSLGRVKLLKERESRLWGSQLSFGNHHMGTTRMSSDESKGVVDSSQKVFGTRNLYIAGSSVFPTGSHVPPTLTVVATTIRLADKIRKEIGNA